MCVCVCVCACVCVCVCVCERERERERERALARVCLWKKGCGCRHVFVCGEAGAQLQNYAGPKRCGSAVWHASLVSYRTGFLTKDFQRKI